MGFYYGQQRPDEDKPPGCMDALIITRAVFAVIIPVMLVLFAVLGLAAMIFILFTVQPALALIPLGILLVGLWLFARWEQGRAPPPDEPS